MSASQIVSCDASTSTGKAWLKVSPSGTASKRLVYSEPHEKIAAALQREKNIKHWSREWKIDLIIKTNPVWRDLYDEIVR
jgi:predicted GIY-YIG superfamily endonuclease